MTGVMYTAGLLFVLCALLVCAVAVAHDIACFRRDRRDREAWRRVHDRERRVS